MNSKFDATLQRVVITHNDPQNCDFRRAKPTLDGRIDRWTDPLTIRRRDA